MTSAKDLKAEMLLASWTDVTPYMRNPATVAVQRGRQNEASTIQPGSATFTLTNDGRFTTRNPVGAYYPNLVQNSPLRLSVPASDAGLSNYMRLEGDSVSSATTPDKAGLQITGPIDVRVDLWPTDYSGNILAAKWGGTAKSWLFTIDALNWNHPFANLPNYGEGIGTGTLGFYWFDGSNTQFIRANAQLPYFGQRIALRVVFTPSTGTAQFYTAPTMAGSWTPLGPAQVFGATTLSAGVGQAVQIGGGPIIPWPVAQDQSQLTFNSCLGFLYEAQILNNVTLEVDPVFSAQTAGTTTWTDSQSSVWTLNGTAEISARLYRFHGEMGSYPKSADPSQHNVFSQASAFGILRRLQNSNTPLQSPMRRAYTRLPASLNLGAYWPCEDGINARSCGSALGGPPMNFYIATPNLAANSDFVCATSLPNMNGSAFVGNVPPQAAGFTWQDNSVRFLWEVPAAGETNGATACQYATNGTAGYVTLVYGTGGTLTMNAYVSSGGTLLHSTGAVSFGLNGGKFRVACDLKKNGSNVDMTMAVLAPGGSSVGIFTATAAFAGTVGAVTVVQIGGGASPGLLNSVMGHVSVQGVADTLFDLAGALNAWSGEPAASRVNRICTEEGIGCRIVGSPAVSTAMGNQPVDTLTNILQDCENTDLGMLFEPRQALAVGYRTRSSMYNQTPVCTASFTAQQIQQGFTATADTQLAANDITATGGPSGSSARQFLASGAMSIQAPPNGISRIDTQITPNPGSDSLLNQIAAWYLSVRSVDDDRYPATQFNLARANTPTSVMLLDIGDMLQITGTPNWTPPPPINQLSAGFQETFGPVPSWTIGVNGIPERPYEVAAAGPSHADTAGSQLTAGISSGAASFQVTTTTGPVWTQAGADFPFDIICDGERMTVTAISSATSPQTFTVTRSVNGIVKAHNASAAVALYNKPILGL